jgi:Tfp pilus assembly protein PilX
MQHPKQRGYVLIVCLVILTLLTLLAATAFNISNTGLLIVGNMQSRNDGSLAAQSVLEQALSTRRFFSNPNAVLFNSSTSQYSNTLTIDVNGDGVADETVQLLPSPFCKRATRVLLNQLSLSNSDDQACTVGQSQIFGVAAADASSGAGTAATNYSLCADSMWEITAQSTDNVTGATQSVIQGTSLRTSTDFTSTSCPST